MTAGKRTIVQIYEIQDPKEAEALIGLGVDHIGSVLVDPADWKRPRIREVVRLVRQSQAFSSLIPLLPREDDVLRALDYYEPQLVHFCELIPLAPEAERQREDLCEALVALQQRVRKEFPVRIIRSVPIPEAGRDDAQTAREAILAIARRLGPESDFLMTDTLQGPAGEVQPVAGYVGITGSLCDWPLAQALCEAAPCPVILAGGIGPDNALEAIRQVRPAGIDSCTRTNARDGQGRPIRFRKDLDAVRRLIGEVRRADEESGT